MSYFYVIIKVKVERERGLIALPLEVPSLPCLAYHVHTQLGDCAHLSCLRNADKSPTSRYTKVADS